MELKTVQWNIGGGKIRAEASDPSQEKSYSLERVEYIIGKLKEYGPDLITLQESHADDTSSQAQEIAKALGWDYFINDRYDQSHIDQSKGLCQSVISRFPLTDHTFTLFFNPPFRKVMENGDEWVSHDKGMTTCKTDIEGTLLTVQTLHLIPFRKFAVDPTSKEAEQVVQSIEGLMSTEANPYLIQGDFNYAEVAQLFPKLVSLTQVGKGEPTTPKGRLYDHILCKGLKPASVSVDSSALTDHYPVIASFML